MALAGALLTALASCDEATAPGQVKETEVTVRLLSVSPPMLATDNYGSPLVGCEVSLEARATGTFAGAWESARFVWYTDPLRVHDAHFQEFTAADLGNAFGRDSILTVRPDTSFFWFSFYSPFTLEAKFHYNAHGVAARKTSTVEFFCGALADSTSAPPVITLLDVSGSDPDLTVGDTVIVTYRIEAPAGLWYSHFSLHGAMTPARDRTEALATVVERTDRFVIPRWTRIGVPISVRIAASDALGRTTVDSVQTDLLVEDHVAPIFDRIYAESVQVAVGSALAMIIYGRDETDLAWIHWEVPGIAGSRDSIPIGDEYIDQYHWVTLPVRQEWIGDDLTFRVWLEDGGGNESPVIETLPGTYRVHPTVVLPASPAVDFPTLADFVYDEKRQRLYGTVPYVDALRRFDVAAMTPLPEIPLSAFAIGVDLTPSGDSVLITQSLDRALSVVDLVTGVRKSSIPLAVLDTAGTGSIGDTPMPIGVQVAGNGKALVFLHVPTASGDRTLSVDIASGEQRIRPDARELSVYLGEVWFPRLAAFPSRDRLVILGNGCFRLYLAATDAFGPCRAPQEGAQIGPVSFTADLSRVGTGQYLLDDQLGVVKTLQYVNSVLTPDGLHALVIRDADLLKVRIADGTVLARAALPINGGTLFLLPNSQTLVVMGYGRIAKVDVSTF